MIRQEIWKFVRTGMRMSDFQSALQLLEQNDAQSLGIAPRFKGFAIEELDNEKKIEFRNFLNELADLMNELNLNTSATLLYVAANDPPKTGQAFSYILIAIRQEMHGKLFLYVPEERAQHYEDEDVLSKKATIIPLRNQPLDVVCLPDRPARS